MYRAEIYVSKNGKSEIIEFLQKLQKNNTKDSNVKFSKITAYILNLKKYGLSIGKPYIKHINKEFWELRPLRYRIIFAVLENNDFVLLNIFLKQTVKTPIKEIEKAKRLFEDYKKRRGL